MKITVNDLAFEFSLYEKEQAIEAIKNFISICKKLESICCHNVERLVRTDIDMKKELFPTGTLYRIIQEISDRDDRKVQIKNISCEAHINYYWEMLGVRIYEANEIKHKKDRENAYPRLFKTEGCV